MLPIHSARGPALATLFILLALHATAPGSSAVEPNDAQLLIITPAALSSPFEFLAQHRSDADGVPSRVVTLEDALATGPAGRDDAETLRNYVSELYTHGNLQYLLLGGDAGIVPLRYVRSTFYPVSGYSDIECDLYFACLDGDWDADGDGVFGEAYADESDPGDEVDLDPELAVGRAPVTDSAQAERFVESVTQYDLLRPAPHMAWVALMAEMLGGPLENDWAPVTEGFMTVLSQHPMAPSFTRLYQNQPAYPGSLPLSADDARAAMASGNYGLVGVAGRGFQAGVFFGDRMLLNSELDGLGNAPNYFLFLGFAGYTNSFGVDSFSKHLLQQAGGGAAGAVAFSNVIFPAVAEEYMLGFLQELVQASGVRLGDAMRVTLSGMAPDTDAEGLHRWTNFTWCLLGDPAMPFRVELNPIGAEETSAGGLKSRWRSR